jgi:hypothetical protein
VKNRPNKKPATMKRTTGKQNNETPKKRRNTMRTLLFFAMVAVCMLANQMGLADKDPYYRKIIDALKRVYGIEEHKNNGIEKHTRITPADGKLFDSLPCGLKVTRVSEDTKKLPKLNSPKEVYSTFVADNSTPVHFTVVFDLADRQDKKPGGFSSLDISYFPTADGCRDHALTTISVSCSMPPEGLPNVWRLVKDNKIGDDLCFLMTENLPLNCIVFTRQNTCFSFHLDNVNRQDLLEVARYIDKRFVELNEELNKPKPPEKGKPPEQKTGNDEKNNGKTE